MTNGNICIAVTFLNGRYHGEEWPPSPARLFQALVAGTMTCGYREHAPQIEPALAWLEKLQPPSIRATGAALETEHRLAVPNNDMDAVAREWLRGKPGDPSAIRTMKTVRAWRVEGNGPHVLYYWPLPGGSPPDHLAGSLRLASEFLYSLGWGVDMAFADLPAQPAPPLHTLHYPVGTQTDLSLQVPIEGTLADLHDTYSRFAARTSGRGVDAFTRPSMLRLQPYRRPGAQSRPFCRFRLVSAEGTQTFVHPWETSMKLAAWIRHAAGLALENETTYDPAFLSALVHGHGDGESGQLCYVPIPSITPPHGDGMIRRCLIVEPPGSDGEIIRLLDRKLSGRVLTRDSGSQACALEPPERNDSVFRLYTDARTRWRSVTPVILHGHNTSRKGVISVSKTERLLLRAFEIAGYHPDQIESLSFQRAPYWPGCGGVSSLATPAHLNGLPRLHVEVNFRSPVRGPVLAGLGLHYGIGLFAAVQNTQ